MARRKGEGGGKESTYIFHIFNCSAARKGKAERGEALAKEANHVFTAGTFLFTFVLPRNNEGGTKNVATTSQRGSVSVALFHRAFHLKRFSDRRRQFPFLFSFF